MKIIDINYYMLQKQHIYIEYKTK